MSDIFWIILIVALYWYIIRPMAQGILGQNKTGPSNNQPTSTTPKNQQREKRADDYVEYEEVK